MRAFIRLSAEVFDDLISHLLPVDDTREQAAFLFADIQVNDQVTTFHVVDAVKLQEPDFDVQAEAFLQLTDQTRTSVIKRAHDSNCSLVEVHSHPGLFPAAFSLTDIEGLGETVPHMWWRLPKRPYCAIVVAPSGFDALVWLDDPKVPRSLDCLVAGDRMLRPTNQTLTSMRRT